MARRNALTSSRWSLFVLVGLALSACGTSRSIATRGSNPVAAEAPGTRDTINATAAPSPAAAPYSEPDGASNASAPAARQRASDAAAPKSSGRGSFGDDARRESESERAESRPGLATHWGETRFSGVRSAPFQRQDPYRPFAVTQVFYNDAEGVNAVAARSNARRVDTFSDPSGRLDVAVLDEDERPLRGFDVGPRSFVIGEAGERYTIHIRNDSADRVEAVATVDGLDVIDGQPGAFSKRGYLIEPWSTLDIEGFRRSEHAVAAFRFGSVDGSYAERKGDARNVGVIAVAFFREQGRAQPWIEEEAERRRSADPFPGRFAEPPTRW